MAELPTQKALPQDLVPTRPERVTTSLNVGERIGRYEILDVLGVGGGGAVYKAFDETLKRNIALKVLHAGTGDPTRAVMLREGRALAQFSHPNVVAVHDVGEAEDKAFIAMELAEGERLDQWLRAQRPWHHVLKVFLDAGRGLAAVHEAKLVHRDFKPGNVVVRADGRVQLIDFGIARPDTAPEGEPTVQALISGTPGFMAPEHMRGEKPGAHSDQFSFCCALYEALTGVLPFGESADLAQLTRIEKRQLATTPKGSKVPKRVLKVLDRGLAFDGAQRFPSMDELVRALARTLPLDRVGWTGVATLSLAAGAAIGFMWLWSSTRGTGCSADIEAAERVWTAERRAELAKKKLPTRTLARLDAYAEGLVGASKTVCSGPQEATAGARIEARACLAQARLELGSLVKTLEGVAALDPPQVERAVDGMLPPSECAAVGSAEALDYQACGEKLFDAVSRWNRGQWTSVLAGASEAEQCAAQQRAPDIASAAHRLRGAVLERLGDTAGARDAYQASVRAALKSRGELLAQAWLALARVEPRERALELLTWTDALLESAVSGPETRARAALTHLRLSPQATQAEKEAWVKAATWTGDDPTQKTVERVARAQLDAQELNAAMEAMASLPAPPVQAVLELADACVLFGKNPEAGKKLLAMSAQALADADADTALARAHVASAARALGAAEEAAAAQEKISKGLPADAPAVARAVVEYEWGRSLRAAGNVEGASAAFAKARLIAGADTDLRRWLSPRLQAADMAP